MVRGGHARPGRHGAESGLTGSTCSGAMLSRVLLPHRIDNRNGCSLHTCNASSYCPEGSSEPILTDDGYFAVGGHSQDASLKKNR